jgi:hypothetical protein
VKVEQNAIWIDEFDRFAEPSGPWLFHFAILGRRLLDAM